MSNQETSTENRLEAARKGIERWRAERLKLGPMPAELWAEAIVLAGEVGVARVARALELDHRALSRRVDPQKSSTRRPSLAQSEFVEVSRALPPAKTVGTVIELTSSSGSRLTVRLLARMQRDLEGEADAILSEARRSNRSAK